MREDALRIYDPRRMDLPDKDKTRMWLLYALGSVSKELEEAMEPSPEWSEKEEGIAIGLQYAEESLCNAIQDYDGPIDPPPHL